MRVGIAVDHRDHRYVQFLPFRHRDRLLVGVDHENDVREAAHFLDAAERPLKLVPFTGQVEEFLLGQSFRNFGRGQPFVQLAQPLYGRGDRFPVGQHAAEPAMVDIVLAAALRGVGDKIAGLALGADEQDASALGGYIANRAQRRMQQRHCLPQVDNVNPVAHPENVRLHLGVPAAGLMSEMNAGFQQLAHRELWHVSFSGWPPRKRPERRHAALPLPAPDGVRSRKTAEPALPRAY